MSKYLCLCVTILRVLLLALLLTPLVFMLFIKILPFYALHNPNLAFYLTTKLLCIIYLVSLLTIFLHYQLITLILSKTLLQLLARQKYFFLQLDYHLNLPLQMSLYMVLFAVWKKKCCVNSITRILRSVGICIS